MQGPQSQAGHRVLIMTQQLAGNYGCLAQAYALQRVISEMGHNPVTNNSLRVRNPVRRLGGRVRSVIQGRVDTAERRAIIEEPSRFVSENIATIDLFLGRRIPSPSVVNQFDAFVVGSDQVWRAAYSDVPRHLLNFVGDSARKIAYAASFGDSTLADYTPELLAESARLARRFDAVSVREDSGVVLCRDYWGVEAEQVVDPTLLLHPQDYAELVERDRHNLTESRGDLFAYILDENASSTKLLGSLAHTLSMTPFSVLPVRTESRIAYYRDPKRYRMLPVTQWLRAFMESRFALVDSFHGAVFSIIFNKPFLVLGNPSRGMARFTSLLRLFGLEDRLVDAGEEVTESQLSSAIDWDRVNTVIQFERRKGIRFLAESLG